MFRPWLSLRFEGVNSLNERSVCSELSACFLVLHKAAYGRIKEYLYAYVV